PSVIGERSRTESGTIERLYAPEAVGGKRGTRLHSRRRPVHYRRSPRADNMTSTVSAIYRYPVKGLSAEKMDRVTLMPGECLPHDRRFAVALGSTRFDPQHPEWLPKIRFVMLMRDEKLARLQTS